MAETQDQNTPAQTVVNTVAVEGEVVKRPKSSNALMRELPLKQRKFVKYYKETGNGTKSAKLAGYSGVSAHTTANRLLKNEKVLHILEDAVEEAQVVVESIMRNRDNHPKLRLEAAKEVLDRTIGKPIQRSESVSVNITVESMLDSPS
jgi:phage terminase small subunit